MATWTCGSVSVCQLVVRELIRTNGFQVARAELEAVLITHPQIGDAAVIGVPDDVAGEVPMGFLVSASDEPPSLEDLQAHLGQHRASYNQIQAARLVETIPKSASGNVLRRQLRTSLSDDTTEIDQGISRHFEVEYGEETDLGTGARWRTPRATYTTSTRNSRGWGLVGLIRPGPRKRAISGVPFTRGEPRASTTSPGRSWSSPVRPSQ